MFDIAPEPKQYERSIKGLYQLAQDWLNTPQPDQRILPAWPLDLLCGLVLLSAPILAKLIT